VAAFVGGALRSAEALSKDLTTGQHTHTHTRTRTKIMKARAALYSNKHF